MKEDVRRTFDLLLVLVALLAPALIELHSLYSKEKLLGISGFLLTPIIGLIVVQFSKVLFRELEWEWLWRLEWYLILIAIFSELMFFAMLYLTPIKELIYSFQLAMIIFLGLFIGSFWIADSKIFPEHPISEMPPKEKRIILWVIAGVALFMWLFLWL